MLPKIYNNIVSVLSVKLCVYFVELCVTAY